MCGFARYRGRCRPEAGAPNGFRRPGLVAKRAFAARSGRGAGLKTGAPGLHRSSPRSFDQAKSSQLGPLPSGGSARAVAMTRLEGTK